MAILGVVAAVVFLFAGCSPTPKRSVEREDPDVKSLYELGLVIRFSVGNGDRFPGSFEEVVRRLSPKLARLELFVCPGTGHRAGSAGSIGRWTDYIYVGNLHSVHTLGVPLVISPPENHREKYGYAVLTDGSVARLPAEQIRKLIADPFCLDTFNSPAEKEAERKEMTVRVPERFKSQYGSRRMNAVDQKER